MLSELAAISTQGGPHPQAATGHGIQHPSPGILQQRGGEGAFVSTWKLDAGRSTPEQVGSVISCTLALDCTGGRSVHHKEVHHPSHTRAEAIGMPPERLKMAYSLSHKITKECGDAVALP